MILSVNAIEQILIEVARGVTAEDVKNIVEAEIPGAVVEQVVAGDRNRRQVLLGYPVMPALDNKEGPWGTPELVFLVTYRKDVSRQFKDAIKKFEKAAKAKDEAAEKRKAEVAEATRQAKIAAAKAQLKALGVEEEKEATGE